MSKYRQGKLITALLILLAVSFASTMMGLHVASAQQTGSNWQGFYWDNNSFSGNPRITRTDAAVNFNWQGGSPDPALPADNFSVRWANKIDFGGGGTFRFRIGAKDAVRAAIDGTIILGIFNESLDFRTQTADVTLTPGVHEVIVDYVNFSGLAGVVFDWTGAPAATAGPGGVVAAPKPINQIPSLPASRIRAVIRVSLANVRSAPSADSNPIAELPYLKQYFVVAQDGARTWYLIQLDDGRRGWIFRTNIYLYNGDINTLPIIKAEVPNPPGPQNVEGVAKVSTMVRAAPTSRNGDKIGVINEGQSFKVLKLSTNRAWVFVDHEGLRGWVYLPNVKVVFGELGRVPIGNTAN